MTYQNRDHRLFAGMTTRTEAIATTTHLTAAADQLAADLRDRRSFHDGEACDALDPCPSCATGRRTVPVLRRLAIPAQRQGD